MEKHRRCDLGSPRRVFQHHVSSLESIFCRRSRVLEALFVQRSQLVWKELNILDLSFSWHVSAILYATHKLPVYLVANLTASNSRFLTVQDN